MKPPQMTTLRVRVDLEGAYIDNGDPIHLDGLLAQAVSRRMGLDVPSRAEPVRDFVNLPLVRACGVWAASAAHPVGRAWGVVVHQTKRRDAVDYDCLKAPVHVASGVDKDRLLRRPAQLVEALEFLCLGNRGLIVDCLRLLWGKADAPMGFIGSVRRSGSGQISRWSVTPEAFDPHWVWVRDGVAQRHIPSDIVAEASRFAMGAADPPYWHPSRQRASVPLGVPVTLQGPAWQALDVAFEACRAPA